MMYPSMGREEHDASRKRQVPTAQDFSYISSVLHACHSGSEIDKFEVFLDAF
jgi:hypothetical protein